MTTSVLKRFPFLVATAAALAAFAAFPAHADVIILGGLGNFDCPNNNGDDDCDEFDIELDGISVGDIYHTYHNPNYGAPSITALPNNTGVRVVYSNPQHLTRPNAIEHFGVSVHNPGAITARRFQWHTVHHVPPPPLPIPEVESEVIYLPAGAVVRQTVINRDTYGRPVWIVRRETTTPGEVQLEQLMPEDPLIQGSTLLDVDPIELFPNVPMSFDSEPAPPGEIASEVFVLDVYENRRVWGYDYMGPLLSTALTATISQGSNCPQQYLPWFTMQPLDVTASIDGGVQFDITADGPVAYGEIFFQWQHEGIDMPGEHDPFLRIDPIQLTDAGTYTCTIHNDCGSVVSAAARLTVPPPPPCPGDLTGNREVTIADLAILLANYGSTSASTFEGDLTGDYIVDIADLSILLAHYGDQCP